MTEKRAFRLALVVALLVYIPIHMMNFKGTVPYFEEITGGLKIFDRMIPTSVEELYERIGKYGEAGRHEYVFRNLTTDFLLPFSLLPLMWLGIARVNRRFGLKSWGKVLLVFPVAFVVLDLVENFSVIWLIFRFPEQQVFVAEALGPVTVVKRAAVGIALVTLLSGWALSWRSKVVSP